MLSYFVTHRTGLNQNKISVRQGDLGVPLSISNPETIALDTEPAQEIINDILESDRDADSTNEYNDQMLIVIRETGSGFVTVYETHNNFGTVTGTRDMFDNACIFDVKVTISQHSDNENVYIIARNDTEGFPYARIPHNGGDFQLGSLSFIEKLDDSHPLWEPIDTTNVDYFDIAAGSKDKQVLFVGVDKTNLKGYIMNIEGDASVNVNCNPTEDSTTLANCQPLVTTNDDTVFNKPVAIGDVLPDVTIGALILNSEGSRG